MSLKYFTYFVVSFLHMQASNSDSVLFLKNSEDFTSLDTFFDENSVTKLFILVDENTNEFCLPLLENNLNKQLHIIQIASGEVHKNLESCQFLWNELTQRGADRSSVLINLGGGVITDMGGFAAATYKRGIRFINIPTTLLAMVDAAIGGKTGIDFEQLKNQIGLFAHPEMTLIYPEFLKTVAPRETRSGLAEVIKYGLIDSKTIWEYIQKLDASSFEIDPQILTKSIAIKEKIVALDPTEKGIRKSLNFGHTLGHAIETHFLSKPKSEQLLHGEAVAIGMILAASLSAQILNLPVKESKEIALVINNLYPKIRFDKTDIETILKLLQHDKKSKNGQTNFVLLETVGNPILDCQVTEEQIIEAFDFYKSL